MCRTIYRYFRSCILFILMLPMPALAISAITCHCFVDRSYDAVHPAAADPYFLATTQNSFFALVFNIDKKTIVMKKQQGTSSETLWIAYWVASKSGISPDALLQSRLDKPTWKDVIAPLHLSTKSLGVRFSGALIAKSSSANLAEIVVDELMLRYRFLGDGDLAAMRKNGISNQELIISAVIAAKTRHAARQIYFEEKNGAKTWGSLLQWANIDAMNMEQEILNILKLHSK